MPGPSVHISAVAIQALLQHSPMEFVPVETISGPEHAEACLDLVLLGFYTGDVVFHTCTVALLHTLGGLVFRTFVLTDYWRPSAVSSQRALTGIPIMPSP